MTPRPYAADFWYRPADDADQSVRTIPQMGAGAQSEAEVLGIIAGLRAQHYHVQKVTMQTTSMDCAGAGRLGKAPKGTRKAKVASLPYWRLTWTTCPTCAGVGYTESHDVAL